MMAVCGESMIVAGQSVLLLCSVSQARGCVIRETVPGMHDCV